MHIAGGTSSDWGHLTDRNMRLGWSRQAKWQSQKERAGRCCRHKYWRRLSSLVSYCPCPSQSRCQEGKEEVLWEENLECSSEPSTASRHFDSDFLFKFVFVAFFGGCQTAMIHVCKSNASIAIGTEYPPTSAIFHTTAGLDGTIRLQRFHYNVNPNHCLTSCFTVAFYFIYFNAFSCPHGVLLSAWPVSFCNVHASNYFCFVETERFADSCFQSYKRASELVDWSCIFITLWPLRVESVWRTRHCKRGAGLSNHVTWPNPNSVVIFRPTNSIQTRDHFYKVRYFNLRKILVGE